MNMRRCTLFICSLVAATASAKTMSVDELANRLIGDLPPVVIDIRRSHSYKAGHIPGALSVPMPVLEARRLPPLGEVVVYCDGLAEFDVSEAAEILGSKPGIDPVILEGGFAAWQTRSGVTTARLGLDDGGAKGIGYKKLKAMNGKGTRIYDLRENPDPRQLRALFSEAQIEAGSPLEGFSEEPSQISSEDNPLLRDSAAAADKIIVLVGDDSKSTAETAQQIRSKGMEQVVVLNGGDLMIELEGRTGFERRGYGSFKVDGAQLESLGQE